MINLPVAFVVVNACFPVHTCWRFVQIPNGLIKWKLLGFCTEAACVCSESNPAYLGGARSFRFIGRSSP